MLNRISVYIHNRENIVSASHTIGCGFATRSGHTKDHDKNGSNCLACNH